MFFRKKKPASPQQEVPSRPSVKILGAICGFCQSIDGPVERALVQLGMEIPIEHVTEASEILSYGVTRVPALVVNEQVLSAGIYLTDQQALSLLKEAFGRDG